MRWWFKSKIRMFQSRTTLKCVDDSRAKLECSNQGQQLKCAYYSRAKLECSNQEQHGNALIIQEQN